MSEITYLWDEWKTGQAGILYREDNIAEQNEM